ncbi:MAG: energy transducer TonB [Bacteroidales bacterium]|nr:energy transducer TonB [Bacteroidales bacterium]
MSLWRYIQGFRKGKDAHRLEKKAMEDPFLNDALEGFHKVKGNHADSIQDLQRKARSRSRKNHPVRNWRVAAGLLLILGLGSFFFFNQKQTPEKLFTDARHEILELKPEVILQEKDKDLEEVQVEKDIRSISKIDKEPAKIKEKKEESSLAIKEQEPVSEEILADMEADEAVSAPVLDPLVGNEELTIDSEFKERINNSNAQSLEKLRLRESKDVPRAAGELQYGKIAQKSEISYPEFSLDTSFPQEKKVQWSAKKETSRLRKIDTALFSKSKVAPLDIVREAKEYKNFDEYVKKELKYPQDNACKDVEGKVELTFFIDIYGRPYDIQVKKSLCHSIDQEAIRLIKEGPVWPLSQKQIKQEIEFKKQ